MLSRCPCLRGPRLGLASDRVFHLFFGFRSLAWRFAFVVVFFSFFSMMVTMGVVNALIKGEIEDQVCPRTSGGSLLSDE